MNREKLCRCDGTPHYHNSAFPKNDFIEILGHKVKSDGYRLYGIDKNGNHFTGAEWKHDFNPAAGEIIEFLLKNFMK